MKEEIMVENTDYRAGFVGIVGQPNAGKSTLMNLLVQEKISIVTDKPQTTRRRILGVVSKDNGQIVYVDAPGLLRSKSGLNKFLEQEALDVVESSDILIAVLSIDEKDPDNLTQILDIVSQSKKSAFVVITKVDIEDKKHRILKIKDMIQAKLPKARIFELSSKWGDDIAIVRKDIEDHALSMLPKNPAPLYDVELFTPHTERELVVEMVREQCFEEFHSEIPYSLAVRVTKFDESRPELPHIFAEIIVSKDSHKPIIIGKGGTIIKKIGQQSREQIEKILGRQIFLSLNVVVRDEWFMNKGLMKDLGYVVENK
jgi:GTPase